MNVLGIVCSPHAPGNTSVVVQQVLAGVEACGGTTKLFTFADLVIRPCDACHVCKRTRKCPQQDDMQRIHDALPSADGLVIGSPIYFDHVSAQAKTFLDRLYPYVGPNLEHYYPVKNARAVTVFTQGHPDPEAYRTVGDWVARVLNFYFDLETVEAVYAASCDGVAGLQQRQDLLDRAAKAGEKLAQTIQAPERQSPGSKA